MRSAEALSTVAVAHAPARWAWVVPVIALLTVLVLIVLVGATLVSAADPMTGT